MIKVDEKVREYIKRDSRTFKARLKNYDLALEGDILSLEIKKGSCGGSLTPGSIYSNSVSCEVYNPSVDLKGRKLTVQIGCELDGTDYFYDVATVYVKEVTKKEKKVSFTAYGVISTKMGLKFRGSTYSKVSELLTHISNYFKETIALSDGLQDLDIPTVDLSNYLYSEILGYIAGLYFGYATEEPDGSVKIRTYTETDGEVEGSIENTTDDPTIYETSKVKGIYMKDAENEEMIVGDEQNFSISNPLMTKEIFNTNNGNFLNFEYTPCDLSLSLGDFTIEPKDVINFQDLDGKSYKFNCMEITHTFDGGIKTSVSSPTLEDSSDYRGKRGLISDLAYDYSNYESSEDKGILKETILISTNGSTHISGKWEDSLEIRQGRFATFRGRNPEEIPIRYAPAFKVTAYPVIVIEGYRYQTADYLCYHMTLYPESDSSDDAYIKSDFRSGWLSPDDTYHPAYYTGDNQYLKSEKWDKHNFWFEPNPDIWYEFNYILKNPIRKEEVII